MTAVYIYSLSDPETGHVRYIGKTAHPRKRLRQHLSPRSLEASTHKNNWLKSLLARGLTPTSTIIKKTDTAHWQADECAAIAEARASGVSLTNTHDGGQGGGLPGAGARLAAYNRTHGITDATRARLREAARVRTYDAETREAMRAGQRRRVARERREGHPRVLTPEQTARMAESLRGRTLSPEHVAKVAAAHRGKKRSPETCARIGAIHRGRKKTPEERARLAALSHSLAQQHALEWIVTQPDGTEVRVRNLREFCRNHGLTNPCMHRTMKGSCLHKGWKCRHAPETEQSG